MRTHTLYTYGTLRPKRGTTVLVPGKLYALGWFPGAQLLPDNEEEGPFITCETIQLDDNQLARTDGYEGYDPNNHAASLFIRQPYKDGWIYTYNGYFDEDRLIESGDWLQFKPDSRSVSFVHG